MCALEALMSRVGQLCQRVQPLHRKGCDVPLSAHFAAVGKVCSLRGWGFWLMETGQTGCLNKKCMDASDDNIPRVMGELL